MQYQTPDFGFIAQAGRQIGAGLEGYAEAKKKQADYNLNKSQMKQAYQAIYDQNVERYMNETGETDPYKAGKFVSNYYLPPMGSEDSKDFTNRLLLVEPKFEAALSRKRFRFIRKRPQSQNHTKDLK